MKYALATALFLACTAGETPTNAPAERTFQFTYQTTIGPFEKGLGPIDVFVPLAHDTEQQTILSRTVTSTFSGTEGREREYGNEFWHGTVDEWDGQPMQVSVEYTVQRRPFERPPMDDDSRPPLSQFERTRHAQFLSPNENVPVAVPILEPILADLRGATRRRDPGVVARAIYDWIVDNVEYKKIGTGWGNGDTYWACTERYGNCTDFHSLFNSLARTEGIPARFEIGFPISEERPGGKVGGYHCWTRFFLPGVGWLPIDASEAFKYPEKRDDFYGSQAADRIHFTTGRDLELGDGHESGALNYFIYPHVEIAGQRYHGEIVNQFSYRDVAGD